MEHQYTVSSPPVSSVEISTNAKGMPQLTVKVYCEDPEVAKNTAIRLYLEGVAELHTTGENNA